MKRASLLIMGLGDLGGYALEFLAREPRMPRIVTADINEDWGIRKTNSAIAGASQMNLYPEIEFIPLDVFDIDKTANILQEIEPTVIYNSMSLQSWWVITRLPEKAYKAIDEARYGPWFPMHFVPAYKLMQAVKKSGVKAKVVNAAFPDLVNPVLAKRGLSPVVGIGNVDNIATMMRIVAAKLFEVPLRAVTVYVVCHHFLSYYASRFGNSAGSPYYLKIMVDDKDMTDKIDPNELFTHLTGIGRRPGSTHAHPVVAASVCRIVKGILFDTKELAHAPGPNGLLGGYPIRLSAEGADVHLPQDLTLEKAIEINKRGQVYDGIESIEEDGTVVITDKSADLFKKFLDFDCKRYRVEECEQKYHELDEKFKKWGAELTTAD